MTGIISNHFMRTGCRWFRRLAALFFVSFCVFLFCGCGDQRQLLFDAGEDEKAPVRESEDDPAQTAEADALKPEDNTEADTPDQIKETAGPPIYVDVDGAVRIPGVYCFQDGDRVFQAIEAAGGFRPDAAKEGLNQAALLADAQKIYVPTQEELQGNAAQTFSGGTGAGSADTVPAEAGSAGIETASADGKVNINTAGPDELKTLNGIGDARAQAILDYRESSGGFASIEEIRQVSGIGDGIYERIRDHIAV